MQEHLLLLHKKLDYAEKDEVALSSAALRDVAPELDALRSKAVAKARDFLMARIYALRKPKTNIQVGPHGLAPSHDTPFTGSAALVLIHVEPCGLRRMLP